MTEVLYDVDKQIRKSCSKLLQACHLVVIKVMVFTYLALGLKTLYLAQLFALPDSGFELEVQCFADFSSKADHEQESLGKQKRNI